MKIDTIDIFCEIIDNYGDIGVAYRLARALKKIYSQKKIRLFINKLEELNLIKKSDNKIKCIKYSKIDDKIEPADLLIECFACNIPQIYMDKAYDKSKLIVNLEYFSSEDWIEDFHLQESILARGKLRKFFFMPGISQKSGGLIIDDEFIKRKEKVLKNPNLYLKKYNLDSDFDLIGSIFSYEKNFDKLISDLEKTGKKILLLILSEKTQKPQICR